jgi:cellulose synthase operon protein C
MSTWRVPDEDSLLPWQDRGREAHRRPAVGAPRSARDLEILRGLARRINPQDAAAHNNLGVVYYNKGLYEEAVHHFESALEIDPRMQVAERNLQICYFGTGYLERREQELRQRLAADPTDFAVRDRLARTHYYSGDLAAATRELRQLAQARPHDASVLQRLARAELKRGDLDASLAALHRAEAAAPASARVHFLIGEVLFQKGMAAEARAALERAVALDPAMADAFHLLSFVYGDLQESGKAEAASNRAAQLNPSYARAEAGLSLDNYSSARYQELIGVRGAAAAPGVVAGGALAHYNLGLAFRQKALYDEALEEFRLAADQGEDLLLVNQAQAEMLLLRGHSGEAIVLYRNLLDQEPTSPKLWNELGVAAHQAGDLVQAEDAYRRALGIDDGYALAWNNLGVVLHHRGSAESEAAFRSALHAGRALADVWRNLALMLHRSDRSEESLAAYEQSLGADPASAAAHAGLGILLLELGRPEDARARLLRAVEIDPRLAEARYHLAFALSAVGDYRGALRETRQALELDSYITTPRFRLLIDLQFEEASVLAPELDAPARVESSDSIPSFHFQPEALDALFEAGPVAGRRVEYGDRPGPGLLASARAALERGLLQQASRDAQQAAMYDVDRVEVLLLQGEIFLYRALAGEAVERFNAALAEIRRGSASDDHALRRALHGAARSLLDLGRMAEAVEAAERLCELVPGDPAALGTLGEALARVDDHARAVIVLEQARLEAPDDVSLLTQLGAAYAAAGDPEGAESALRRAVSTDARAVAARTLLARLLAAEERVAEAESEYAAALRVLPSYGEAAFGLSLLHELNGDARRAIAVIVDLLSVDPYRLDALQRLGDLLLAAGRAADARVAYERLLRFDPDHAAARSALESMPALPAGHV